MLFSHLPSSPASKAILLFKYSSAVALFCPEAPICQIIALNAGDLNFHCSPPALFQLRRGEEIQIQPTHLADE